MSLFRTEQLFNLTYHADRGGLWDSFAPSGLIEIGIGYGADRQIYRSVNTSNWCKYILDWKALLHMTALLDEQDRLI